MTPYGPGGAPREGIRPWLAGLTALGALAMVPLMFADRVPVVLDRISDNIENQFPDVYWDTLKPHFPDADVAMHLIIFSTAAFVLGLLSWSWRSFVVGQLLIVVGGVVIEVLQPVFTSSRNVEMHDVVGNLIGQALGLFAALVAFWAWSWWDARRAAQPEPTTR